MSEKQGTSAETADESDEDEEMEEFEPLEQYVNDVAWDALVIPEDDFSPFHRGRVSFT